ARRRGPAGPGSLLTPIEPSPAVLHQPPRGVGFQRRGDPQESQPGPGAENDPHHRQAMLSPEESAAAGADRTIRTASWGFSSHSSGARNMASARSVMTCSLITGSWGGGLSSRTSRHRPVSLHLRPNPSGNPPLFAGNGHRLGAAVIKREAAADSRHGDPVIRHGPRIRPGVLKTTYRGRGRWPRPLQI